MCWGHKFCIICLIRLEKAKKGCVCLYDRQTDKRLISNYRPNFYLVKLIDKSTRDFVELVNKTSILK